MNCLDIITRAMRRIGVLAAGQLPRDIEAQDALDTLSAIYARLISEGAFGEIHSFAALASITAGENQRIVLSDPTVVVTLPETVADDHGCDPYLTDYPLSTTNARPIRDGAVVAVVNHVTNTRNTYIRDAQAGLWIDLDNLDLTAEAPMSRRDPTGLACYLAVELADEYGQQPSAIAVFNAGRWQRSLTHNYSEPLPSTRGVYF